MSHVRTNFKQSVNTSIHIYSDPLAMFGHVMPMIGVFSFRRTGFFRRHANRFTSTINSNKGGALDCGHAREARLARAVRVAGYRRAGFVDGAQFLAVVDDAEEFIIGAAISGGATRVTCGHRTFVLHVILILWRKK